MGNAENSDAESKVPQEPALSVSVPEVTPGAENLQSDISKILQEVKLPERRSPNAEVAPRKLYDTRQPGQGVADMRVAPPSPAPAVPTEPNPENIAEEALGLGHKPTDIRAMHTLKDDLQNVVKEKKISLVRAVALEEQKRARKPVQGIVDTPAKRRWGFAVFASLTLFTLGFFALAAVFIVMQDRAGGTATFPSSILFAEQAVPLPIDNLAPNDIRRSLGAARDSTALTLGAIMQIVPIRDQRNENTGTTAPAPVSFADFIRATGINPPQELLRALGSEFFLGIHTVDENAPVVVITVDSYERAFAAMLEWESRMNADLEPFFTPVSRNTTGSDGLPALRNFEDTVMRNYDVRVLKDDSGTIQLYYSFPTRNILIIAESPYTFTEVLSRLRADRRL